MGEVLEKCVLSTTLGAPHAERDPFEGLDFSIAIPKGMRLATRIGQTCIFNRTGRVGPGVQSIPTFVFGATNMQVALATSERENFALNRLKKDHPDAEDIRIEALTIANRPAIEIKARDASEGVTYIYLAFVFEEKRYWRALLHAEENDEQTLQDVSRSVRDLKVR